MHFYEPQNGHGLRHDPWNSIVAPRPIGWITTVDQAGRVNLAPYSFFNALSSQPPIVFFASQGRKDSLANARATGEFVCSLATRPLAEMLNVTATSVPHGVDEMQMAGLEAAACRIVKPPRVAASPTALECKVIEIHQLSDLDGNPLARWIVIGQVVGVHIKEECIRNGIFDMAAARTIARCGHRGDYIEVGDMFEMLSVRTAAASPNSPP